MNEHSVPTRGRTLDHAAIVYDFVEPIVMFGRQAEYNRAILSLLTVKTSDRVLDLGCGTGVLTRIIADQLDASAGGAALGIDAAAKMVRVARKRRESPTCRFDVAAAEKLPYESASFDAVVSSLFFHHLPIDLKEKALSESYRVLRPGGRLVIADMHRPTTRFGAVISYAARWLLVQPEIGENIRGVLPDLIERAGFAPPRHVATYWGYLATFVTNKPKGLHQ